jgi:putative transposase
MKKSRFIETQVVGILKETEGVPLADFLRSHGISGSPFIPKLMNASHA